MPWHQEPKKDAASAGARPVPLALMIRVGLAAAALAGDHEDATVRRTTVSTTLVPPSTHALRTRVDRTRRSSPFLMCYTPLTSPNAQPAISF